jgi:uncharacterized membrane protein
MMGVRELSAGIGILAARRRAPWLWGRVAGDAIDLAALTSASGSRRADGGRVSAAMGAVAAVTVVDALCAWHLDNDSADTRQPRFTARVVFNRSPEECYRYWHDIEKLPTFIEHLKSVRTLGDGRSHWVAKLPGGKELSWDAQITEDRPNESIAWRSVEGSDFPNSGRVRFEPAPGDRGTIVRVLMEFETPVSMGGGTILGKLLGSAPEHQVRKDLMRFKQLLEAGEIATTEGQSAGRRSGATSLDRLVRA